MLDEASEIKRIDYGESLENYIEDISSLVIGTGISEYNARLLALRLLDSDDEFCHKLKAKLSLPDDVFDEAKSFSVSFLDSHYKGNIELVSDDIGNAMIKTANAIAS